MQPDKNWKERTCGQCDNWVEVQLAQQGMIVQKERPKILQCRANPPGSIGIPLPTPQGLQLQVQTMYPKVELDYPACRQFTSSEKNDTIEGDASDPVQLKPFTIPHPTNDAKG